MYVDNRDVEYRLIDKALHAQANASKGWDKLEELYLNVLDPQKVEKAKKLNRSYIQSPIVRDTILIKRSIFSSSFNFEQFPITIESMGQDNAEAARQLRIASKQMWKQSNPYIEIQKAALRLLIFPIAVMAIYWDRRKHRIVIEEINPKDIAFDPDARNANDVRFLVYRVRRTGGDILDRLNADRNKPKKDRFYNKLEGGFEELFGTVYDPMTFDRFKRYTFKELYIKQNDGSWICKTYDTNRKILIRETTFRRCPFVWGYAREQLSSVNDKRRSEQIMVYGESEVDFIKEYAEALNKRRNQHSDIVEEQINPSVYIGTGAKVNASDLKRGPGGKIPCGDINQIRERRAPTTVGVHDDLAMLKDDIETTTSINGLYKAQTNASDRRAAGALAILSSQASTRIEEQIMTANKTLFSHLAKNFVHLVYTHVDDTFLSNLGIDDPVIGKNAQNKSFDFTVNVSFGSKAKRDEQYQALMEGIGLLGQFQGVDPSWPKRLLEDALRRKIGDDYRIDDSLFAGDQEDVEAGQNDTARSVPGGLV